MWHLLFLDEVKFQKTATTEQGKRTVCLLKVLCKIARIKWNNCNLKFNFRKLCQVDSFSKYFAAYRITGFASYTKIQWIKQHCRTKTGGLEPSNSRKMALWLPVQSKYRDSCVCVPSYEQLFQDTEKPAGHSAEIAVHGKTENSRKTASWL